MLALLFHSGDCIDCVVAGTVVAVIDAGGTEGLVSATSVLDFEVTSDLLELPDGLIGVFGYKKIIHILVKVLCVEVELYIYFYLLNS